MHPHQQAQLNAAKFKHKSTLDRLNAVLTYIEFFKSSMTDCELLTAIQDQMDKHSITKQFINNLYEVSTMNYYNLGPVALACVKLYEIITELESKFNTDHINLNI